MGKLDNEKCNQIIDNELKKKELEKKYGARFGQNGKLSPELENKWLKNIEEFEQQFRKHETISVWQYIGKPTYKKLDELEPEEISSELQRLFECMEEHNVSLDTLAEVGDKELYEFITEEFFLYEMDNIQIDGMVSCFIYEEFHPNAKLDVEDAFYYFFKMTMKKMKNMGDDGYDLLYIDTSNYLNAQGKKLNKQVVVNRINDFLNSFDYFEIVSIKIKNITINKNKTDSLIDFYIHYKGRFNNSLKSIGFKGNGVFKLKPSQYGGWDIYRIDMPGLKI